MSHGMGWVEWIVAVTAAGAVATVAAGAREADACSPPREGVHGRTVLPEDGAVEVPRNARVQVVYDTSSGDPGNTLELRALGGPPVAVTTTTVRTLGFSRLLTPAVPLAPMTTYQLVDTLTLPCDSDYTPSCVGEPAVVATFTTGATLDTTPPALTGISVDSGVSCASESCEDAEIEQLDTITIASRADDAPTIWLRYEYLSVDGEVLAGPTSWLTIGRGCGGAGYFQIIPHLTMPSNVQLRAVDLAGNVEATPHLIAGGTCDLVGDTCDPDGGAGGGPGAEDDGAAGCGCATGPGAPGSAALTLAALLLLARRRRRPRPA